MLNAAHLVKPSAETRRARMHAMQWLKAIVGVVIGLIGRCILQGLNLLQGSSMTGQAQWAIIGLILVAIAAWLLWSFARARCGSTATSSAP